MKFYTTEELKIGPKRYFTPEGFLVCEDVPIGRVGEMLYGPGETPVEVGPDGIAHIDREADELFSEPTLASFNGKAVTDDHPTVDVTAQNWRDLSMGFVINPRQGKGALSDFMVADLLLTDPIIIQSVMAGKRQVSSGYSNDYIQFEPGHGRQVKIRGNHVALVDSGRCGVTCSIRDHRTIDCNCNPAIGDKTMAVMFSDFVARVKNAWKSKDEKTLDAALAELGKAARSTDEAGEIHVHAGKYDDKTLDEKFDAIGEKHATHDSAIADHENRIGELEKPATQDASFTAAVKKAVDAALKTMGLDKKTIDKLKTRDETEEEEKERKKKEREQTQDETEEEEKERKRKEKEKETQDAVSLDAEVEKEEPRAKGAKDSAYLEESFQQTIAYAEILSPGVHIPTFDRAAKPGDTFKQVCGLRRKALQMATRDSETALLIKAANGGRELTEPVLNGMTCDHVRTLFFASGALKKEANNAGAGSGTRTAIASGANKLPSIAEINKRNRDRKWPGQA